MERVLFVCFVCLFVVERVLIGMSAWKRKFALGRVILLFWILDRRDKMVTGLFWMRSVLGRGLPPQTVDIESKSLLPHSVWFWFGNHKLKSWTMKNLKICSSLILLSMAGKQSSKMGWINVFHFFVEIPTSFSIYNLIKISISFSVQDLIKNSHFFFFFTIWSKFTTSFSF